MVNKLARWEREGIPHKGWKEMGVEDLGEDLESGDDVEYEQCEMCGQEKIRYTQIHRVLIKEAVWAASTAASCIHCFQYLFAFSITLSISK